MAIRTLTQHQAQPQPVTETIGGITFEDPFEWLEEDSPTTLEWQSEQDAVAVEYLRSWPGFGHLRERLMANAVDMEVFAPHRHGDLWFQLVLPPSGEGRPVLRVSEEPCGSGRVLVDPNALSAERPITLDWFYPSPDGRYVAYGLSEGGSEESVLHIIETATGAILPERIPFTMLCTVAWLPDSSGFYYRGTGATRLAQPQERLYVHRLGDTEPSPPEPIPYEGLWCYPQISADGRYVAAIMGDTEPRPFYIKRLPDGEWTPFLRDVPGLCIGTFVDDSYIAVSTAGHPRGHVVAIPIATAGDASTWRELVPESEAVLQSVSRVGDHLVLGELVDVHARLTILSLDGTRAREVPLPAASVVNQDGSTYGHPWYPLVPDSPHSADMTFVQQSLTRSPSIWRYNVDTSELNALTRPGIERDNLAVRQMFCTSRDGARIPFFLLHRRDLDLSRPNPTLVHAYGGFNYSLLPGYYPQFVEFAESGGIFMLVNARGGSEYGADWWHAARLARKQNTFNDVYAAIEALIDEGMTEAGRVAFAGWSNGGMLSGVMLTQRPELFGAVVPVVPLFDLFRVERDPWTATVAAMEYGDPHDAEQAQWLYTYSPYHNIRDGVPYPATLVPVGASDVRCPPWHGRKFVARLQRATASDKPVLLRVWQNTGHQSGLTPADRSTITAEWLGFIMEQLGMEED